VDSFQYSIIIDHTNNQYLDLEGVKRFMFL